jgi:SAM-dependent methyltransferase
MSQTFANLSRFAGLSANYAESPVHARGSSIGWLKKWLSEQRPAHLVDLAAGAGHASILTAPGGTRVTAVDLAPDMLTEYGRRAAAAGFTDVTLLHASAEALPIDTASADAVVCRLGMHHVQDLNQCLAEVGRILKAGGSFYLVEHFVGNSLADRSLLDALFSQHDPSHAHTLDVDAYAELAQMAGMTLQEAQRNVCEVRQMLPVDRWFELARTPDGNRAQIKVTLAGLSHEQLEKLGFFLYEGRLFFDVPVNLSRFVRL